MTDIVERLLQVQGDNDDAREAAAEIERLRKTAIETMQEMLRRANEIERLRAQGAHLADALYAGQQEIKRLRVQVEQCDRIMNMSD